MKAKLGFLRRFAACRPLAAGVGGLLAVLANAAAGASLGFTQIPGTGSDGPVSVFYATGTDETTEQLGTVLTVSLAREAPPLAGNRRLVIISHGSGGSPYVHVDLARRLVEAGFLVAMPEHHADNFRDLSEPGPASWTLRPAEVSRAIDSVGRDPRFAPLVDLDRVGLYGMSAGGHTALSLAGGRWSPARFAQHCRAHLEEDFPACVGLSSHLTGGWLDGLRKWIALRVIEHRFSDETLRADRDPRVAAIVAAVPFAADFDPASLEHPPVPLGFVTARQDRWLAPRLHADAILKACAACERLVDLPDAGHGSALSPLPRGLSGTLGDLLNDPPGFDRPAATRQLDDKVTAFFVAHLL